VEAQFWQNRWRNGQIGFHQSSVDGNLRRHWPELPLRKGGRVFVPLCGKSLDLLWLRDRGHVVMGVELSARGLEDSAGKRRPGAAADTNRFRCLRSREPGALPGRFFQTDALSGGRAAAVYDRAALISWAPELRAAYVDHLTAIVRPGTQMLLITLEYPQAQMSGPPFSVDRDEVESLYSKSFEIRELSRQDILAQEDRLRSLGVPACSRCAMTRAPLTSRCIMADSRHSGRYLAPALAVCAAATAAGSPAAELTIDRLFDAPALSGPSITACRYPRTPRGSLISEASPTTRTASTCGNTIFTTRQSTSWSIRRSWRRRAPSFRPRK